MRLTFHRTTDTDETIYRAEGATHIYRIRKLGPRSWMLRVYTADDTTLRNTRMLGDFVESDYETTKSMCVKVAQAYEAQEGREYQFTDLSRMVTAVREAYGVPAYFAKLQGRCDRCGLVHPGTSCHPMFAD